MTWLILGLALWTGAHLFKRIMPGLRARLGNAGRALVAILILTGVVLMIVGYRDVDPEAIYVLPLWAWHLNNLLMFIAIFLLDAGRARGVVAAKLRHPMLTGVVVWAAAHLLVNGDWPSLVLFGGLGLWALLEMAVINRAEGSVGRAGAGSHLQGCQGRGHRSRRLRRHRRHPLLARPPGHPSSLVRGPGRHSVLRRCGSSRRSGRVRSAASPTVRTTRWRR